MRNYRKVFVEVLWLGAGNKKGELHVELLPSSEVAGFV